MHRLAGWPALFATLLASTAPAADGTSAQSSLTLGVPNQLLADGSKALAAGRFELGIRLTLAGLELPNNPTDEAAARTNVCAGYAALKRWDEALQHCNRALELARGNWRTYNNRAAVWVGLKKYELAMSDVNAGLTLAPNSLTLQRSLKVVNEHYQAAAQRDRRRRATRT